MLKKSRSLLLASALLTIGVGGLAQAADDPIFDKAKQAFDAIGKGNSEPAAPLIMLTASDPQPVKPAAPAILPVTEPAACAQGKCAVKGPDSPIPAESKSCCSCLKKIGHWFNCEARTDCACSIRPSYYWPSVYAWFPLVPGMSCATPGGCSPPCGMIAAGKHYDAPLPKPQMPKIATAERPLVPGSSTVMAVDNDSTGAPTTVNYKSLPVVPTTSPPTNLNGSR